MKRSDKKCVKVDKLRKNKHLKAKFTEKSVFLRFSSDVNDSGCLPKCRGCPLNPYTSSGCF